MGTTSSDLALAALEGLSRAELPYALIHGGPAIHGEGLSDLDTVVDRDAKEVVRLAAPHWSRLGLSPVLLWPYDIGGALTVFLATRDASGGVQLDLLYDPEGRGKYGIRSHPLLVSAVVADGIPVVSEPARIAYLWRKRSVKGQLERLARLRDEAGRISSEDLERVCLELTGSHGLVRSISNGRPDDPPRRRHAGARLARLWLRLTRPIGFWAHLGARDTAVSVAARLGRFLALVGVGEAQPVGRQLLWITRRVVPVRHRAGVFLSWGGVDRFLKKPDVVLGDLPVDQASARLVAAMTERTLRCVS